MEIPKSCKFISSIFLIFSILLSFVICVISFIIPISAESYDSYDSRYLTSEEKDILAKSYHDDIIPFSDLEIIKLYSSVFMYKFAKQEDIMSMIEPSSHLSYMFVADSVHMHIRAIRDGEGVELLKANGTIIWEGFYTYTKYPNLVFDTSVKVNKIYCLDALVNYDGAYIYYETDHGEYILFKEYTSAKNTYLFPLSDFYKFAKLYMTLDGDVDKIFNMESYLISDTPHAVPHSDDDSDKKCDVCEITIPEDNTPFPDISHITSDITDKNTDKVTDTNTDDIIDNIEETKSTDDKVGKGCGATVTFSTLAIISIICTPVVFKKKKH